MMNISVGPHGDIPTINDKSGSYEWWYFDAVDSNNSLACTIILFNGMPMSPYYLEALPKANPQDFAGYSVAIYHKGRKIAGAIHHTSSCIYSQNEAIIDVHSGGVCFRRVNDYSYHITIDTSLPSIETSIQASFTFIPQSILQDTFKKGNESHSWRIIAPDCNVIGTIAIKEYGDEVLYFEFDGKGYHDSNAGSAPLYNDYNDWYWGRVHLTESLTLIYYSYPEHSNSNGFDVAYLIDSQSNSIQSIDHLSIIESKRFIHKGGIPVARSLILKGMIAGNIIEAIIEHRSALEFSPFYYRFLMEATIMYKDTSYHSKQGIAEYFKAQALQSNLIRTMIKTPIVLQKGE